MSTVELDIDIQGYGRLTVDGVEQEGIRVTTVRSEAGGLTTVELEHAAAVLGTVEAPVEHSVYVAPVGFGKGATLRDALADLIRQIDLQEV